jgi:transcriptional regulator with XRE-family HTH domain
MGRAPRLRIEKLPEKLKQIRETLGLSQNELIRELGFEDVIYQGNVSEYESGRREPPLPILLRYAQIAGVCLDIIVSDNDELPEKLPSNPKHKSQI